MGHPFIQRAVDASRSRGIAELAAEAAQIAKEREHFVSHLSPNIDSVSGGFEDRGYGVSFARNPHERMSSPVEGEPSGKAGVVFARVGGKGLDYSNDHHRSVLDALNRIAISEAGSNAPVIPALRDAGVSWVDNWDSIGEAPELHVVAPSEAHVRKVVPVSRVEKFKFPRPDSDLGIVIDGNWQKAATLGPGQPEVRGLLDGLRR